MIGNIIYPISVSKSYKHRGRGIKHSSKTKKIWTVYGYGQNEDGFLYFTSVQVNYLTAIRTKLKTVKLRKFYCKECKSTFPAFQRNKFDIHGICPYCESDI
jgi:hypothetical protein